MVEPSVPCASKHAENSQMRGGASLQTAWMFTISMGGKRPKRETFTNNVVGKLPDKEKLTIRMSGKHRKEDTFTIHALGKHFGRKKD